MFRLTRTDPGRKVRGRPGPCPRPEEFARAFLDETPVERKFRLLDHMAACPDCCRDFQAVLELWRRKHEIPETLTVPEGGLAEACRKALADLDRDRPRRAWFAFLHAKPLPIAAGAAALFLVAFAAVSILTGPSAPDLEREVSSGKIAFLAPRGDTLARPYLFRWSPVKGAESYTLDVLDAALLPVLTVPNLTEAEHALSAEEAGRLEPGKWYFWKVRAALEDLKTIESGIGRFRIPKN